jgi:hypothetical protein
MHSWLKNTLIFLSGASFFHFISHLILPYYMELPLHTRLGEFTMVGNVITTILSGLATVLLLWGAWRVSRDTSKS